MSKVNNHIDAVSEILKILNKFDSSSCEKIIRWTSEELNVSSEQTSLDTLCTNFNILLKKLKDERRESIIKLKKLNKIEKKLFNYNTELNSALYDLKYSKTRQKKIKLRDFSINDKRKLDKVGSIKPRDIELTDEILLNEIAKSKLYYETLKSEQDDTLNNLDGFQLAQYDSISKVLRMINNMNTSIIQNFK